MAKIYVSFKLEDRDLAREIAGELGQIGITSFTMLWLCHRGQIGATCFSMLSAVPTLLLCS